MGCWPEKAQQRVELWLGESDEHQQGVKDLLLPDLNVCNLLFVEIWHHRTIQLI